MKVLITRDFGDEYIERMRKEFPAAEITKALEIGEIVKAAETADVILAGRFDAEILASAKNLRWIQSSGAGVNRFLFPEFLARNVVLTNARGIRSLAISEHVLALMLAFTRRLNLFIRFQLEKRWDRRECEELGEKTVGIIGLGSIGNEIARKVKSLGMATIAIKRSPGTRPAYIDEILPTSGLKDLLSRSDFVVVSAPLTPETHHMIGEKELRTMKKQSILINIGRGKLIDQTALTKALKERWIAGAGLDVFETEPLPEDSELWDLDNVIITPHVAGSTPYSSERLYELFIENLNRFSRGQPLINLVDKTLAY